MSLFRFFSASLLLLLIAGCASEGSFRSTSPTVRMLRGEINADQFAEAVTSENENQRALEEFEANRIPSRAFNTKTKRYEDAPADAKIVWNEEEKRWEFTPPAEKPKASE